MYMTKEKFDEIKKKYPTLLVLDDDVGETLDFVQELLEAEADALKNKCGYATRSIAGMESAARQVFDVRREIDNGGFGDGD